MQAAGRARASPALQLWEAYHSSSALAGTLRGAVRAHLECEHLAQLLETVSELLCFVFSRYNDALFLVSLNTHVSSAAQLLHFGLLKVCRVADSCCNSCASATSSSTAPFSPATTTSSAASAAADIQLAVTVLATAVQYLEATHGAKQADAAAPQVLPGPRASLQVQQQALLQSGKKAAAAHAARRSTGGARQLLLQPDAVQLFNSTAVDSTASLAGNVPSSSAHTSNTYTQQEQQQEDIEQAAIDATSPAVEGEATFDMQWQQDTTAEPQLQDLEQQQEGEQQEKLPPPAAVAVEAIGPEAYQAAKLQALQELLRPGSTWSLEDGGAGFVCKPGCSSGPQQSPFSSPSRSPGPPAVASFRLAAEDAGAAAVVEEDASTAGSTSARAEEQCTDFLHPQLALAPSAGKGEDAAVDTTQPDTCNNSGEQPGSDEPAELLQQEAGLQEEGSQEADAAVNSTAWLQQQLQQIYSNALLQGRKPQQERHSMLRRSQELMCGVTDAAELPLLPARAQSPEPAGFGLGFVSAGFNSSSGSGARSVRESTEDLVAAVLGRRGRSTPGGTSSMGGGGGMNSSSMAAAAAAGVVTALYEPSSARKSSSSPGMGKRSPFNTDAVTAGNGSRSSSSGGGMVGTCSPRGYAGRSYASRAASVSGSVSSSRDGSHSGAGARSSRRRSTTSSPGSAIRTAPGSGRITPIKPTRANSPGAAAQTPGSCEAASSSQGRFASSQDGSSSSGCKSKGTSSDGQGSARVSSEWQAAPAAASVRSPSRTSSPSPARQSQSGVRASRDSILGSSRHSMPGAVDGAGSTAYEEALALAASAAGTAYKSASSSGDGSSSISGGCGLTRRSSASSTLFMSARSSHAGSTAGSVASCHEGTGRMRMGVAGGAGSCSVTSAAGASVLGLLAAAAAGAAEEAAVPLPAGIRVTVSKAAQGGSSQEESWLAPHAAVDNPATLQLAGRRSGTSPRTSRVASTSCSGVDEQLPFLQGDGLIMEPASSPPAGIGAGSKDPLVTGMGCLTLGSCSGARSGRASLSSGSGSAAMAESVQLARCSFAGGSAAGGGSRQVSGQLGLMQQQQMGAGSRSGSSAGGRASGRSSACGMTGEMVETGDAAISNGACMGGLCAEAAGATTLPQPDKQVEAATAAAAATHEGAPHLQQEQDMLEFLAAGRQDTMQGRKSAAAGTAAAPVTSPANQPQLPRHSQQVEAAGKHCSSDVGISTPIDGQHSAETGLDAWQQQQEQWQARWQQQQQTAASSDECEAGLDSQQQVEQEFSLCTRPVQATPAQHQEQAVLPQQQRHAQGASDSSDEAASSELREVPCADTAPEAAQHRAQTVCGVQEAAASYSAAADSANSAAASSDDFGDFQGSPHAAASHGSFAGAALQHESGAGAETVEARDMPWIAVAAAEAAAAKPSDRSSLMLHSPPPQLQLAVAAEPAAANISAGSDAACPAATPEAAAEALLAEGNAAYTAGRYSSAVQRYAKALDSLGGSIAQTTSEAGVLLWIKCSLNLACCHLRLGQFKQCVALCDSLLEVDHANIVALCHRGRALLMVQQHAAAKADLTEALELLEEEAAEQVQQQQSYMGQQQPMGSGGQGAAVLDALQRNKAAAATAAGTGVGQASAGPLLAAGERTGGGAIRPSSRRLSPCTLARMRLNNSYWQQRVVELLASVSKADPAAK